MPDKMQLGIFVVVMIVFVGAFHAEIDKKAAKYNSARKQTWRAPLNG